jgi:ribonuclease Y
MENLNLLLGGSGIGLGVLLTLCIFWIRRKQRQVQLELATSTATRIIDEAKKEASAIKREGEIQAKDGILQSRVESEKEVREARKRKS